MKCAKILPSLLLLITSLPVLAGANTGLHGVVRDQKGNLIAGAEVVALAGGKDFHTRSGLDGSFAFPELGATTAHLRATEGLRSGEASVDLTKHSSVELVLALWGRSETVSVTATRFLVPREATPELRHLPEEAIADTPALSLDEVLRQIPSFTLFRRTPGWSANPTAQGVSLRGLGASGASRDALPVKVEKLGERSYKLTPSAPLVPGEYGFLYTGQGPSATIWDFGIDPAR